MNYGKILGVMVFLLPCMAVAGIFALTDGFFAAGVMGTITLVITGISGYGVKLYFSAEKKE